MRVEGHKHPICFGDLVHCYGEAFCQKLVGAWEAAFALAAFGWVYQRSMRWKRFLLWLAIEGERDPAGATGRVYRAFRDGHSEQVDARDFMDAVSAFAALIRDFTNKTIITSTTPRTRSNFLCALSSCLKALAKTGFIPDGVSVRGLGKEGPYRSRTPSLAELTPAGRVDWDDAEKAIQDIARHVPADSPIGAKLNAPPTVSLHERLQSVAQLSVVRLAALRACAVHDLLGDYAFFKEGQSILARTDLPTASEVDAALQTISVERARNGRHAELHRWTNQVFQNRERLHAALVRYIAERYGGAFRFNDMSQRLQMAIAASGGSERIVRRLEASSATLMAAHTIVMIDTGFNPAACDNLPVNPFTSDVRRNSRRISTLAAIKTRAGGKIVEASVIEGEEAEIHVKGVSGELSSVRAIEIWCEMSAPIRRRAQASENPAADMLWILPGGKNNAEIIRSTNGYQFTRSWKRFLHSHADDPLIGKLPITRKMLRVTVLQIQAARNNLDHLAAQVRSGHADAETTMGYINAPFMRSQLAALIRDYQRILEAALVRDIQDVASKLGVSPEELTDLQEIASETGLGFICLDAKAGIQPGTKPGKLCDKFEGCPGCPMRRFVATARSLEALYLTHRALVDARVEFESRNPMRWVAAWLPWLAITKALIRVLKSGPLKVKYQKAAAAAEQKLKTGAVALPILW